MAYAQTRVKNPYQQAVVGQLSGGYQPDAYDMPEQVAPSGSVGSSRETYTPPQSGISGQAGPVAVPNQSQPAGFNGSNYQEYIMGLLGGGNTSEQKLRSITDQLRAIGVENQIASDGTARGRIHIPGIGPVTLIGDRQTWGDGGWAWRTGNEQYGSGGGGTGLPGGGGGSGGANPEVTSAFVAALMKLLNPSQATLSDPDLASQSQANKVAQQRSYERRRASAAERAAQGGQMGGGFDANVDTLLSARGDAEAAFDADLLARKNDQNRESQLAALGPALSLFGLNQNESQFGRDIALRKALAEAGLNQSAILSLLGGL
jgi:hypothetical protein